MTSRDIFYDWHQLEAFDEDEFLWDCPDLIEDKCHKALQGAQESEKRYYIAMRYLVNYELFRGHCPLLEELRRGRWEERIDIVTHQAIAGAISDYLGEGLLTTDLDGDDWAADVIMGSGGWQLSKRSMKILPTMPIMYDMARANQEAVLKLSKLMFTAEGGQCEDVDPESADLVLRERDERMTALCGELDALLSSDTQEPPSCEAEGVNAGAQSTAEEADDLMAELLKDISREAVCPPEDENTDHHGGRPMGDKE